MVFTEVIFERGVQLARPLGFFIIGLAIYSLFIFKFYRFLAKREIFNFKLGKHDCKGFKAFIHGSGYLIKHLIVLPIFLLFWVLVLSSILAFLSKNAGAETILLISVALIGVIRVMGYYDEDLSKDLSKMLPFALLGVFLVDISYFSIETSFESIGRIFTLWELIFYYLLILVLMELVLRLIYFFVKAVKKRVESLNLKK